MLRPHVEYASGVWNPFEKQYIKALEAVQHFAIRFACFNIHSFPA